MHGPLCRRIVLHWLRIPPLMAASDPQLAPNGCRWAAVPQDEWPTLEAQRAIIESDFDSSGPYGDRRQV